MYERFEEISKIKNALQNANNVLAQYNQTQGVPSFVLAESELQSALSYEIGIESKFAKYINLD